MFINSHDESSEKFIGEWAEARGIRDQLVIATKVILFNVMTAIHNADTWLSLSTLSTSRLVTILSFKKSFTPGIVRKLCTSQ
jgi:hypothetical protein